MTTGSMAITAVLVLVTLTGASADNSISGPVKVTDGDTWAYVIRPGGIDAPELNQVCKKNGRDWMAGMEARDWLRGFLKGKTVTCVPNGELTYGRLVADCTVNGVDLKDTIVRAGWAWDYPKYSGGRFAGAEAEARSNGRGVHSGECEKPWEWRARRK